MSRLPLRLLLLSLLLLSACKLKDAQPDPSRPPGPPTRFGDHMTPAFSEVATYVTFVKQRAAQAFMDSGERAYVADCHDPRLESPSLPTRNKVGRCVVRVNSLNDIQLTAEISNGWLIVSDAGGNTHRVTAQEFPDLSK